MFKSIPLGACLVCMAALIGAGVVPARPGGFSGQVLAGRPSAIQGLTPTAANAAEQTLRHMLGTGLGPVRGAQATDLRSTGSAPLLQGPGPCPDPDDNNGPDGDNDCDDHAPTPEPGTLLSFGAALAIGGGVFFLGRLRRERK